MDGCIYKYVYKIKSQNMETQDILKMLNNLEQSLQNVESARQQVTNTVNAYEGAKAQLHALTMEFNEVSSDLNKVYNAIKENVDSIDETLKVKIDSVFESINKKVDTLDATAEEIQSTFEKSCNSSVNTIKNSIHNNIEKLNNGVDQSIVKFREKVKLELNGISSALSNLKSGTKEIQESFRNSNAAFMSDLKILLNNIADDFKASVEQHILSFTSLKNELKGIIDGYEERSKTIVSKVDNIESIIKTETTILKSKIEVIGTNQMNQHEEIITKLKSLREGHIKTADNLSERFNTVDTTLRTLSSSISELKTQFDSKEKDLYNTINSLKGEVTSSKKLLIFCFITIIISLLLNLTSFIKLLLNFIAFIK